MISRELLWAELVEWVGLSSSLEIGRILIFEMGLCDLTYGVKKMNGHDDADRNCAT